VGEAQQGRSAGATSESLQQSNAGCRAESKRDVFQDRCAPERVAREGWGETRELLGKDAPRAGAGGAAKPLNRDLERDGHTCAGEVCSGALVSAVNVNAPSCAHGTDGGGGTRSDFGEDVLVFDVHVLELNLECRWDQNGVEGRGFGGHSMDRITVR
jgi:hypothetical protein